MSFIPKALAVLSAQMLGLPPFKFNKKLYSELLTTLRRGRKLKVPQGGLKVKFENGDVDGVLGSYDAKTDTITIDQFEILVVSIAECGIHNIGRLKKRFDHHATRVLAHEGDHWKVTQRYGKLPYIERALWNASLTMFGLFILWLSYIMIAKGIVGGFIPTMYNISPTLGIVIGIISIGLYLGLLLTVGLRFLMLWRMLAAAMTYKFCYLERSARSAEERAAVNPRWESVIEME